MIKNIAIGVAVIIAVILALASMQPNEFTIVRKIDIKAPPEKILPLITDFHQWGGWSPWEKMDPAMQRTHSGAASGKGAVYHWKGNDKVGEGQMEILDVAANKVGIKLDFLSPFEAHNRADFALEPKGDTTTVNWTMTGPSNFMTKLMGVFVSMDKMVGPDFEKGLASMKAVAEAN
jgi:uncharacterized protein YndB with AHSA1/START domain